MNNSEIGKGFNQQAQSAQNPNEQIEQNKQDMRIDGSPTLENKANVEHEAYIPTLEMKGNEAQKVRQGGFEEKQAKLWLDSY